MRAYAVMRGSLFLPVLIEDTAMANQITNKYGYQQEANVERGQQGQESQEKPVPRSRADKSRVSSKSVKRMQKSAVAKRKG